LNIELLTLCEVNGIEGEKGNFQVEVLQHPRYIDIDKCIGCGTCAEKCPKKVTDAYNEGLARRKAVYVPYPQAVPLKYAIDASECIYFKKGKCRMCEKFCPTQAINFADRERTFTVNVGSVVLAPGFKPFNPQAFDTYNYARHPNVMTSMEFERVLSASGPTMGHLARPSDEKEPQKLAFLQCVGSRDINRCDNGYCSAVCCMYAIKEAVIAKEHAGDGLDCSIFFMDMRTHGKDFERYYNTAESTHGVRFVRSRIHTVTPLQESDDLLIRYTTEEGELVEERFDLVVLSVGLETSPEMVELARKLGVELTAGNFCQTETFSPVATTRDGIYVCGAFQGPKDIPQSVIEASSAAAEAGAPLSAARNTRTKEAVVPEQRNVVGEPPRIGAFICRCGINIAGVVDVDAVVEYAKGLPYVDYVSDNLYSCSQDTQDRMAQEIRDHDLNRIVVAACTPKTHEPLFQETLVAAGLNKYLFEMTNIRNQDSWVHKSDPQAATEKAKDLVRMAISKVALMEPLQEAEIEVNERAMVIGGGLSGMAAAQSLSAQGYPVTLVERAGKLGGQALNLFRTWKGEDIQEKTQEMAQAVEADENIDVLLDAELKTVEGFVGNFKSVLSVGGKETEVEHGVAVIATGAMEIRPTEYLYGEDPRVMTHQELDRRFIENDSSLKEMKSAVFIQCVGSREPDRPYCSRVCCTHSMESALHLKELNPDLRVYILYRDIRTYGEKEFLYKKAREAGVIFVRYDLERKPDVRVEGKTLQVQVFDPILGREIRIPTDLLALAGAIVPYKDEKLAQFFKVPMNEDGFFVEAHAKLAPSEFATDGVFLCGMAHYPKPIDESVAQAQAAASRAMTLLARKTIATSGTVAAVNPMMCSSCGVCITLCPYNAPSFIEEGPFAGRAQVNPVLCKGCGLCVASCRSGAINLRGFGNGQIMAMIDEM
jgi:heterodisulfide reductase subunit A